MPGTFDAVAGVDADQDIERVVPGMTGQAKVIVYRNKQAKTVPANAVRSDKENNGESYVLIAKPFVAKPEKRKVETGRRHEGQVEILHGLKAGEVVRLAE